MDSTLRKARLTGWVFLMFVASGLYGGMDEPSRSMVLLVRIPFSPKGLAP